MLDRCFRKSVITIGLLVFVLLTSVQAKDWDTVDADYKHASAGAYERWRNLKYGLRSRVIYLFFRVIRKVVHVRNPLL